MVTPSAPRAPGSGGGIFRSRDEASSTLQERIRLLQALRARSLAAQTQQAQPGPAGEAPLEPQVPAELQGVTPFRETESKPQFGSWFGSGVLENIVGGLSDIADTAGGIGRLGVNQLVPGEQGIERSLREVREEQGKGSARITDTDFSQQFREIREAQRRAPGIGFETGLPVLTRIDTKGLSSLLLDPLNAIPGAVFTKPIKLVGKAAKVDAVLKPANLQQLIRPSSSTEIFSRVDRLQRAMSADPSLLDAATQRGPLKWAAEKLGGYGATVTPDDVLGKSFIAHAAREQEAAGFIRTRLSQFRARGNPFTVDDAGNVTNVGATPSASRQLSQVFEDAFNPQIGYQFNPEQASFITDMTALVTDAADMMRSVGLDFGDVVGDVGRAQGSSFFPRIVLAVRGTLKDMRPGSRTPVGAKPANLKSRTYLGQSIEEGVANGIVYENNPLAIMEAFLTGSYRATRDKMLADDLAKLAKAPGGGVRTVSTTASLPDPAFAGKFFDEKTAAAIERQLGGADVAVQIGGRNIPVAQVGDLLRTAKATADFSAPFIQGIFLLARNPKAWATGFPKMFHTFLDPKQYDTWLYKKADVLDRASRRGLVVQGSSEFFAGLQRGGLLPKAANKLDSVLRLEGRRAAPGAAMLNLFGRFETSFHMYGDYARVTMYEALEPMALRGGDKAMREMVDFVNKATGTFTPGQAVFTPSQQAMERAFMFFAPRYTRASLALASDMLRGGTSGALARDSMVKLAAGGAITYLMFAEALGQDAKFDPRRSDFMTVQVGEDRIGIGSFWTSFVRLLGNVMTDPALAGAVSNSPLLFQSEEPGQTFDSTVMSNPIVRWLRGRSSVLTGISWDIASGHDFLGNPIEPGIDLAKYAGSQLLPFALESAILSRPRRPGPVANIGEVFGARAFPLSLSQRRNALRDEMAQRAFEKPWGELNKRQQQQILEGTSTESVELAALTEEARRDRVVRGESIDHTVDEWFSERDRINAEWQTAIDDIYSRVSTAQEGWDLPRFREALSTINSRRRTELDGVDKQERFQIVQEWLSFLPDAPGRHPDKPEDIAYFEYLDKVIANDELVEPDGFDFRKQTQLEGEFRQKWGAEIFEYVQARLSEGRALHPLVAEFYEGRERFEYYWAGVDNPNSVVSQILATRNDSEALRYLLTEWETATDLRKKDLEDTHANLRGVLKMRDRVRGALRERDQELDAFLFRWGYTTTFRNRSNRFSGADMVARDPQPRSGFVLLPPAGGA